MCGSSLEPALEKLLKNYDAIQVEFVLVFGVMFFVGLIQLNCTVSLTPGKLLAHTSCYDT